MLHPISISYIMDCRQRNLHRHGLIFTTKFRKHTKGSDIFDYELRTTMIASYSQLEKFLADSRLLHNR